MGSDPLRKACHAEQTIQIRLELDLTEGCQLQRWLTDALQAGPHQKAYPGLQSVLAKLTAAADQAVRLVQCPVCQAWFAQGRLGRSAQYCSAACKQKAYRQRRHVRKRKAPTRRD